MDAYDKKSSKRKYVNYWELPEGICVRMKELPFEVRFRNDEHIIIISSLIKRFGKNPAINIFINSIVSWRNKRQEFQVNLPISLESKEYIQLYAVMLSEGSHRTEFRLHVPEKEFHEIFKKSLTRLFLGIRIHKTVQRGFPRSSAPRMLCHILPISQYLPKILFENKELANEYLKIAFEAEAHFRYAILRNGVVNRRIKLVRNQGIDS